MVVIFQCIYLHICGYVVCLLVCLFWGGDLFYSTKQPWTPCKPPALTSKRWDYRCVLPHPDRLNSPPRCLYIHTATHRHALSSPESAVSMVLMCRRQDPRLRWVGSLQTMLVCRRSRLDSFWRWTCLDHCLNIVKPLVFMLGGCTGLRHCDHWQDVLCCRKLVINAIDYNGSWLFNLLSYQ